MDEEKGTHFQIENLKMQQIVFQIFIVNYRESHPGHILEPYLRSIYSLLLSH